MLGEVMLSVFAKAGHWVEHVGDGELAWQRLLNDVTDFDVVVTDHEMPRMNGLELVRRLREADFRGKIVVHSSAVGSNELAQYRALGGCRHHPKRNAAGGSLGASPLHWRLGRQRSGPRWYCPIARRLTSPVNGEFAPCKSAKPYGFPGIISPPWRWGMIAFVRDVTVGTDKAESSAGSDAVLHARNLENQLDGYTRALRDLGAQLATVSTPFAGTGSVFVQRVGVLLPEVAVIGCSTVTDRLPDAESIVRAIAEHRPVQSIAEPGLLDGGDVMRIGRTLYVAESHRTNTDGVSQLREIAVPFGYDVRTVEIRDCTHLKTGCSFIPPHFVVLNPKWVSPDAFGDMVVIPVDEKEPFAANTLTIGKTTLVSASHPKTEKRLKEAGITTRKLNISEIEKAQAGLSCISLLLEPRPAVQAPGEAAPRAVHAGGVPGPSGHASQAVVQNGMVYVSAQTAFEEGTKPKRMSVEEQAEQAIRQLSLVLTAAGSSLARVVRTTVHVANPKDMERIDAVYARLFGPHRPARTIVANGALGAGVAVAIEAIAATGNEGVT